MGNKPMLFIVVVPVAVAAGLMILLKMMPATSHLPSLREKAEMGNVQAMIELAQSYDFRWTSDPDHKEKALNWYKKATDRGHLQSAYFVGMRYLNGDGVPQNRHDAAKWLKRAAEKGHGAAVDRLAQLNQGRSRPSIDTLRDDTHKATVSLTPR